MTVPINQAISAYNKATEKVTEGLGVKEEPKGQDFSNLVKDSVRKAISDNKDAEKLSMAAIAGKADINEVVTAVAEAEVTVQAVVNIRDKVIESYKQIIRMPV